MEDKKNLTSYIGYTLILLTVTSAYGWVVGTVSDVSQRLIRIEERFNAMSDRTELKIQNHERRLDNLEK